MKRVQRGFTLIELVMVIVILGVLAAVAIPKFVDLKGDAQKAAMDATSGSAASASAINYGGCSLDKTNTNKCKVVNKCVDTGGTNEAGSIGQALKGGKFPTGYTVTGTATTTNGSTMSCILANSDYTGTKSFEVISAGN